jgi:hypothetical protein
MLPVNCRLFRSSGSSALKNGAPYSSPLATPVVTPRVLIGDAVIAVLVPPASLNVRSFCEYCSLAKYVFPRRR